MILLECHESLAEELHSLHTPMTSIKILLKSIHMLAINISHAYL
jgi:hypothetical protein